MALFCVINLSACAGSRGSTTSLVWWKLAIIVLVIVAFLVTAFHGVNFTRRRLRAVRAARGFSAIATAGIIFSYLGFRQGIELGRREQATRGATCRSP